MRQETINQLSQAAIAGDTFAMTYLGVIAYEGKYAQRDTQTALQYLQRASQNGVIWARDLLLFAMRVNQNETNISEHALITTGATQQLEQYAQQGNCWAATAIGELYMRGVTTFRNISAASQYLQQAANAGCLLAQELLGGVNESPSFNTGMQTPSKPWDQPVPDNHDYMKELQGLIGLSRVKGEVESLRNFVLVQKQREANGLKPASVSYHCVFSGSPGTGKTTVARIVAGIYKEMGILKKGHLVEVQRADLVGEYMGQTAPKTNAKIDEALDGVLFIDEAYSLADGSRDDQYGREAVDTILKRMEDDRDRLVVILAGYSEPIKGFIHSNPGLESRFNRYIHFDDYTADELLKIFAFNLEKAQYTITRDAYQKVYEVISNAVAQKDERFGNARYVRNLFERIIQRQADRVAHMSSPTREDLGRIEKEDIIN